MEKYRIGDEAANRLVERLLVTSEEALGAAHQQHVFT